ncbi:MAG TPA: FGGY family carbohydrate kinase [Saprospiraceae bacterium]|nr:FGGY family carbohydrate kinase [Saprospiraceae bacterium]HMQ81881.1 FGGY family carbohydrate kinase [Saprospiraceae bacterium]
MYLLGYDIGSSSIKAALVDAETGAAVAIIQSPDKEMPIQAVQPNWAEQHPSVWWEHVCLATQQLIQQTGINPETIKGIGISYQMHGLVLVDKQQQVLRPAIIWCDSRAVKIGASAFDDLGEERCLSQLLNSPGNFTASKLRWVKENEPELYERMHKFMLPGDYIAMRFTGEIVTTPSGLSEGILWDFSKNEVSQLVMDYYGFAMENVPTVAPTCSIQGVLTLEAAKATGLTPGIPVAYRAGDQPNNALSLNVLQPGEVAATGGTSGVVYGVVDRPAYDPLSRVNGFAHVNHSADNPRIGILLCINGAGIQYSWARNQVAPEQMSYPEMEKLAANVPVGADGLRILPFGNGAERMLGNKETGARINNLQFNRHERSHFYRAALEGVAFSFAYGIKILREMGLSLQVMRVGNDNLFQSSIFSSTISNLVHSRIEIIETTGAIGAAKAAGVATGIYASLTEAMSGSKTLKIYEPTPQNGIYEKAYALWEQDLSKALAME